jgi:lysozyme
VNSSQSSPGTYTVARGDYLIALANRFQTTWQELAVLNDIPYPYTIYAGQVLQLPVRPTSVPKPARPTATPSLVAPTTAASLSFQVHLPLIYRETGQPQPAGAPPASDASQSSLTPSSTAPPVQPEEYIVRRGDYLVTLAKQLGFDWQVLADLNNIRYPYVIYPGQVLKLK